MTSGRGFIDKQSSLLLNHTITDMTITHHQVDGHKEFTASIHLPDLAHSVFVGNGVSPLAALLVALELAHVS